MITKGSTRFLFRYLCVLLPVVFFSCTSGANERSAMARAEYGNTPPGALFNQYQAELHELYDTVFPGGYRLSYRIGIDQLVQIYWGDSSFSRVTGDELYPGWSPSEFAHEWNYHIGMKRNCGSPCWTHFLLPKNLVDPVRSYDYPLLFHPEKDLLFYREFLNENSFIIENINSRQKIKIVPAGFPENGFFLDGVDTAYFKGDFLVFSWKTETGFGEKIPVTTQMYPLDALYPKWRTAEVYSLLGIPMQRADGEYFDSLVTLKLTTGKTRKKVRFTTRYSSNCDTVKVDVLPYPGIENSVEVVRVTFEIPTCCTEYRIHYFLVDGYGNCTELPQLEYDHCDCPGPHQAYVFPNEKFGQKNKILRMALVQDEEDCGKIREAKVIKEIPVP